MSQKPLVVILHGIFRTAWSMRLIEIYLRWRGYDTLNLTYPSNRHDLATLSDLVGKRIEASEKFQSAADVHFVTHSMGGLITRYILNTHPAIKVKTRNIVMMVPPNQGSETADYIVSNAWMKCIFEYFSGPAGPQLTTAYAVNYPSISGTIGIIAGVRSSNPLAKLVFSKDQQHDGTISHDRMRLDGIGEVLSVKASHTSIVCSLSAMRQTVYFLQDGQFKAPPTSPAVPGTPGV